MVEEVVIIRHTIQRHAVHITCFVRIAFRRDGHGFAILQMQGHLVKVRCSQHILVAARAYGVEAHSREYIPCRGLSVILVATIAIRVGSVELVHGLTNPVLGLPGLARIAVEVEHVLYGLVAVGVVTHVHNLHLANLVDDTTVVAVIEHWRYIEHRVEHLVEVLLATHEIDESLRVVEYRPCVVPTVALGEGIAPFEG